MEAVPLVFRLSYNGGSIQSLDGAENECLLETGYVFVLELLWMLYVKAVLDTLEFYYNQARIYCLPVTLTETILLVT